MYAIFKGDPVTWRIAHTLMESHVTGIASKKIGKITNFGTTRAKSILPPRSIYTVTGLRDGRRDDCRPRFWTNHRAIYGPNV